MGEWIEKNHRAWSWKRVLADQAARRRERPENVPHASEHSLAWQTSPGSATWHYEGTVFVAR